MKDPVRGLREELTGMQQLLTRGTFLSFSPEEKQALLTDSQKLIARLDALSESILMVGLLGGTGVGKSTIMNALAGQEISSTSHRRPHTDKVLIYHHEEVELPSALRRTEVPWRDFVHGVDSIRQILLCDLPDFDSLLGEHRRYVLGFLEHLDVLVWVTSLEKYGDRKFYEFLSHVPKARQNFYFVINKLDILFDGRPLDIGYEELARVTGRFKDHLAETDIPEPLIFPVSARESLSRQQAPWNQFPGLRHQIFQQRDIKEITAIKASNLDVEVQQIHATLQKEVFNLEALHQVLDSAVKEVEGEKPDWVEAGQRNVDWWVEKSLRDEILVELVDPSPLVGPGYLLARLIHEWDKWARKKKDQESGPTQFYPPESTVASLRRHLARLEDRVVHQLLRLGLPASFMERLKNLLDVDSRWEDLTDKWRQLLEVRLATDTKPRLRRFKGVQYVVYLLLFIVFFSAIAGEQAWRGLIENPGSSSILYFVASAIYTLFSPAGLAALGTYVVLNLFLAFRFYGRYKKLLQRRAQRFIELIKAEVQRTWEEELEKILDRLREYDREVREEISSISTLRKFVRGD